MKKSIDSIAKSVRPVDLIGKVINNTVTASTLTGESVFGQSASAVKNDILGVVNPFKLLFSEVKRLILGIITSVKDVKKLIPAIVVAVIWIILTLLPRLGINPFPVKFLSFLTFAQGGTTGGLIGAIGGVLGKGIFAYFITTLIMALLRGKNPFKEIGTGFSRFFGSVDLKNLKSLPPTLFGCGTALIAYNIMTGDSSLKNSMVAVVAVLLSVKALNAKAGFLKKFIGAIIMKFNKNEKVALSGITPVIVGWTTGFALSIPLSAIPFRYVTFCFGIVGIIAGIVLLIVNKNNKEVQVG